MILLLDIGNTRLKWAVLEQGQLSTGGAVVHEGKPEEALSTLDLDKPQAIRIASVAGPANEIALNNVCFARWQLPAQFARSESARNGLRNGYAQAHRLGVDRWLAMLAAWSTHRCACVVVDAGTALTVDVIDASGQHLGGIIAAGLQTSEKAVLGATRFPARELPLPVHAGLGLDTEACVRQGAMLSVLGAIRRASAVQPDAHCILTGGDAPVLQPFLSAEWEYRESLVFEGMSLLDAQI